ncbi:hypothetical protein EDD85DRAFT_476358 [Armillaria nabsnona]|nr:hypothetical protein EDD85DRAFT_476358 [Armillaria nabsnona]
MLGISCMQIFLYFFNTQPQNDNCGIKFLVVWLWSCILLDFCKFLDVLYRSMDTVHQGLVASGLYKMIRENTTASTDHIRLEYIIQILFTVLVAAPAQGFFAYRIWMFNNKSKSIITFLAPTILFQPIDGTIFMVINLPSTDKLQFTTSTSESVAVAYFIVSAAVDLFIAITTCFFLWRRYLRIGIMMKGTRSMMHRLILFSINTGTWPAVTAIVTVVMLMAYPTNYLYVGLYFFISPIYCNTVLASINVRPYIQSVNGDGHISMPKKGIQESGIHFSASVSRSLHSKAPGTSNELELTSYKVGPEELTLSAEGNVLSKV